MSERPEVAPSLVEDTDHRLPEMPRHRAIIALDWEVAGRRQACEIERCAVTWKHGRVVTVSEFPTGAQIWTVVGLTPHEEQGSSA